VSGRLRSLGLALGAALGLSLALAGAIITACYDIPRPSCGFLCGPGGACPDGYGCAADMYCHRDDTPPDLVCARPDAAVPADATADAAADAAGDDAATIDAPDDAPIDAAIDAPP
jgi:hypothetical protein